MKLDDIVLLGFVDEALKYLKHEAKEEEKPEIDRLISQLDIEKMKGNLNSKFGNSFIGANEVIKALMKSGNEAFFEFTKKEDKNKMINEINDIFDDSFLGNKKEDKEVEGPNLGKLVADNNNIIKQERLKKDIVGFVNEVKDKLTKEENSDLPFINDDDDIYNAIRNAAIGDGHIGGSEDIPYDENELNKVINDINNDNNEYSDEYHNQYVSNLMNDLQKRMEMEESQEANVNDVPVQENNNEYVSSLMGDLQKQMKVDEESRKEAEEKEKIYKEISEVYEHIPRKFIHVVYDARQSIVEGLIPDQRVILLHRVRFDNIDNLRQFAEILLSHEFNVNVDEDQKIVDGIELINNTDGKIIASIFEVANQAYSLEGVYDGYRVIKEDDANI